MNTILAFQNAVLNEKDVLIIDGVKSEYIHSAEQEEAISHLSRTARMSEVLLLRTPGSSEALSIYIDNDSNVLISSNFINLDQIGRRMTYSFYCKHIRSTSWLISRFRDYCRIAGMEPNESDILTIERSLNVHSKRKIIITVGIAALTLLIIHLIRK